MKIIFWKILAPLSKSAEIKVQSKVYMGVDSESVRFEPDSINKIIYVTLLPDAQILSIDSDLRYDDISEGLFNDFDEKDLTAIQKKLGKQSKKKWKMVII